MLQGATDAAAAAVAVSGLEVGGLLGNLSSGFLSDWMVKSGAGFGTGVAGKRVQVTLLYSVGTLLSLGLLWAVPSPVGAIHWWVMFLLGHFVYGPQLLVALIATDVIPKSAVATANGFIGWVAYLGATSSGYPLTLMVKSCGWNSFFWALVLGTGAQLLFLLPLWSLRSSEQVDESASCS